MTRTSLPEFFFPQAAIGGDLKTAEPYWDNPDYCAQKKEDGARYILHKCMNGFVRVYSRQISKKTGQPVDKTAQLLHLAKEFMSLVPAGTVIDGEVCAAKGLSAFNLVTKVTGSKPERAKEVQDESGYLVYRAFDFLAYDGKLLTDLPYAERLHLLSVNVFYGNHKYLELLPVAFSPDAKRTMYEDIIKAGGEGIILKNLNAPYHQGKRDKSWVKVKRQRTFDVVFMGIELAKEESVKKGDTVASTTRIKGKAGAIRYGQFAKVKQPFMDGLFAELTGEEKYELKELGTTSGFDDATRDDVTANAEKYVGRVFEVTAQAQFPSGALQNPRFLQWRDDKNAEQCVFRKNEG